VKYIFLTVKFINLSADGYWGDWTDDGDCSVTCGTGTKDQVKMCVYDDPTCKGVACDDDDVEEQTVPCTEPCCPSK
jgi:hypothetical protein